MDAEDFILLALQAIANVADDKVAAKGASLGGKLKAAVDSSETKLDDFARDRIVNFLEATIAAAK